MNLSVKFFAVFMIMTTFTFGQSKISIEQNSPKYKHSIGTSLFMFGNLLEDSPDYVLLTYGYQLSKKDRIFIEFNTWRYSEPLGTYNKSEEFYPGFVRASGVGIGYQRFHWKGAFTTVQATPFVKQYHDSNDNKIQNGFQLYLQVIAGYRFSMFKERLYIEPAYALKYWPVDNNFPSSFAEVERGAPKYIFEVFYIYIVKPGGLTE